jgi:homogentisate 1,2-dioxygenase
MKNDHIYLTGFGSTLSTEAVEGALPIGCNSPQRVPFGLYAEQFSATAFTAPRALNARSWLYRIRPSAGHGAFSPVAQSPNGSAILPVATPNRLRWSAVPIPDEPTDFLSGLFAMAANGGVEVGSGCCAYVYAANRSMERLFQSSDGEFLIVPQEGELEVVTEMGVLIAPPGHIAVIPRGLKFKILLRDAHARGYACENYGQRFTLPELGPIGSNGLANARDFEAPVANFQKDGGPVTVVQKFQGNLWQTNLNWNPLDVVAWHGNLYPYRYDLARFNAMGTVTFDHPDPSIFTVLTSPSELPGTANCDFVIFPPRWMVAENTFRPPWFHRNVMSEFMGLILGKYDAKADGFLPGGVSLHNCMNAHGPDKSTTVRATGTTLQPEKVEGSLAFMFESRWVFRPTAFAMDAGHLQPNYDDCWEGFEPAAVPA